MHPAAPELAPTWPERALAVATAVLSLALLAALVRGQARWGEASVAIWAHLLTAMLALGLTPMLLLMRRGSLRHRWLGSVWLSAMFASATLSLFVRVLRPGHFSPIHLLAFYVMVGVPRIWWLARNHRIAEHRRMVVGMVFGALVVAGWLTLPFNRLLGRWLLGG